MRAARFAGRPTQSPEATVWPGVFALLGIVLLLLAAFGVTAGRVSLTHLGAASLATAVCWPALTALGG